MIIVKDLIAVTAKEIIFATSNKGKVATLRHHLKHYNMSVVVIQQPLDLMEPQADNATEVAKEKARQAYSQLKKPVLVDDSSFHITELGGFPGPYIKYMLSTIGVDGILSFMKGRTDRSAYFLSSLIYVDEDGELHIFEDAPYHGKITETVDEYDSETAWSDLYKIFIPSGSDKVLARMNTEDHKKVNKLQINAYEKFSLWLKNN